MYYEVEGVDLGGWLEGIVMLGGIWGGGIGRVGLVLRAGVGD